MSRLRAHRAPWARAALALVALLALTACGIRPTGVLRAGDLPRANGYAARITVYLVRGGVLRPVTRPGLPGRPYLAVEQLAVRPTPLERAAGLRSEVLRPLEPYTITDASDLREEVPSTLIVREIDVQTAPPRSRTAIAQIACTAQAIPGIERVQLLRVPNTGGEGYGGVSCDQFADLLPS